MKIEYTLVAIVAALIAAVVKHFAPDFPLPDETYLGILLWLALQLGVEIVGKPLAARVRTLMKRFK